MELVKKYGPIVLGMVYAGLSQYAPELIATNPQVAGVLGLVLAVLGSIAPQPQAKK